MALQIPDLNLDLILFLYFCLGLSQVLELFIVGLAGSHAHEEALVPYESPFEIRIFEVFFVIELGCLFGALSRAHHMQKGVLSRRRAGQVRLQGIDVHRRGLLDVHEVVDLVVDLLADVGGSACNFLGVHILTDP